MRSAPKYEERTMERTITQLLKKNQTRAVKQVVEALLKTRIEKKSEHPRLRLRYMIDDYQELVEMRRPRAKQ